MTTWSALFYHEQIKDHDNCLVGLIVLLNAIYFPQLYKEGWGNNNLHTLIHNEYGLQRTCDYPLWQPPVNCRFTGQAQNTLELLRENGLIDKDSIFFAWNGTD